MKCRILLFSLLLIGSFVHLRAQGVGGGLSLAGVASQIDGDQWRGYNKLGLSFGGFAWYEFNERLGLQAEILYGHRGSREVVDAYGQISMNFIDVPVLLRVNLLQNADVGLTAEAGPSVNTLLSVRNGFKDLKIDQTSNYHRFNSELHLGATAYFQERFGLFLRWSVGLNNLWAATPRPWMTIHYFSLGARLAFK